MGGDGEKDNWKEGRGTWEGGEGREGELGPRGMGEGEKQAIKADKNTAVACLPFLTSVFSVFLVISQMG